MIGVYQRGYWTSILASALKKNDFWKLVIPDSRPKMAGKGYPFSSIKYLGKRCGIYFGGLYYAWFQKKFLFEVPVDQL